MIKVLVSYSSSEAVTFSFWKHFFQICGIWVTERMVNRNKESFSREPQLFILNNDDIDMINENVIHKHVYLVKENASFKPILNSGRQDVFGMKRWYDDGTHVFGQIIPQLFADMDEQEEIAELLEIFISVGMWQNSWLFHEFSLQQKSRFDEEIYEVCSKALNQLKQVKKLKRHWNYEFMKLYCKYMQCRVKDRGLLARMEDCEALLKESQALVTEEWNPSLFVLAGKICELSPTENKRALSYYISAANYEKQSPLLYDIGCLYEKLYGDNESAFSYYHEAYKCDERFYRALYKIGIWMEEENLWMDALQVYYRIRKQLRRNGISALDIEYSYKCCRRILRIYRSNISDDHAIEEYKREIQKMDSEVMESSVLDKLINCMVAGKEFEKRRREVLEEVRNKLHAY